jgi:hypothetical protein
MENQNYRKSKEKMAGRKKEKDFRPSSSHRGLSTTAVLMKS